MKKTLAGRSWRVELYLLIPMLVFLIGCGAGKTLVTKPPATKFIASSVDFEESDPTVNVPNEVRVALKEKLGKLLYEENAFQKGSDLYIKYRFMQYDPGNQFTRWFWGGIGNAGEGTLTVEIKYFDADNNELSTIQSEGKISSGFFGGEFDFAVQKVAEEIAEYTMLNFK